MEILNLTLVILTVISCIYLLNNSQYALSIKERSGYVKIIVIFLLCVLLILVVNKYLMKTPILNIDVGETMLHLTTFSIFLLQAICVYRSKKQQKV
jgi:hypothetical protein